MCLGGRTPVSSSATKISRGYVGFTPQGALPYVESRALTIAEIAETVEDYAHAARTAIAAGFDGIEVHGANGYLLDQFQCDNINLRTDAYGGSVEKRARIVLEVVDAIAAAIGPGRTAIRTTPFAMFQETDASDIFAQYGYTFAELDKRGLSYIHICEPRADFISGESSKLDKLKAKAVRAGLPEDTFLSIKPFRDILKKTVLVTNGAFDASNSVETIESGAADAVAYGRFYISNPDLPERLAKGYPLAKYDRATFYTAGNEGYLDYPTYAQESSPAKL